MAKAEMTPMARRPSPCPGCATCRRDALRTRLVTALVGVTALLLVAYFFLVQLPALAS